MSIVWRLKISDETLTGCCGLLKRKLYRLGEIIDFKNLLIKISGEDLGIIFLKLNLVINDMI